MISPPPVVPRCVGHGPYGRRGKSGSVRALVAAAPRRGAGTTRRRAPSGSLLPVSRIVEATYRVMVHASLASSARRDGASEREQSSLQAMGAAATLVELVAAEATPEGGESHCTRARTWPCCRASWRVVEARASRGPGPMPQMRKPRRDTFFEAYARWRYAEALMAESAPAPLVEAAIATARPVAVRAEAGGLLRELDAIAG